jgi:acyl-CoA reductase-like NAD-dependent aldehyde dehydrogenase
VRTKGHLRNGQTPSDIPSASNVALGSFNFDAHDFPAANWAALGICYNTGQDCTAGSRVYVQDTIYEGFLGLLVSKVNALVVGDGMDDKSAGGPLV